MLPQADDKVLQKILSSEAELHARIYQFPTSAIKLNGRKINYYDFICSAQNEDCNAALMRIVPRIDIGKIEKVINAIPCITDLQQKFYKYYIKKRYELIIMPTYESIMAGK